MDRCLGGRRRLPYAGRDQESHHSPRHAHPRGTRNDQPSHRRHHQDAGSAAVAEAPAQRARVRGRPPRAHGRKGLPPGPQPRAHVVAGEGHGNRRYFRGADRQGPALQARQDAFRIAEDPRKLQAERAHRSRLVRRICAQEGVPAICRAISRPRSDRRGRRKQNTRICCLIPLDPTTVAGVGAEDPRVAASRKLGAALQHHQEGRLSEAEAAYREILAIDPDNIDALHFLGVISHQRGEHGRAAELISRALSRNASNAPAHNNLGNTLGAQGKLNEAVACYLSALALDPDYVDALLNLGAALRAQGKLDSAVACYKRAQALAPNAPAANAGLRDVLRDQSNVDKTSIHRDKAPALEPESCEWHFDQGNSYKDQARWDEAVASYEKALSLAPDFSPAYVNLGNMLNVQGKPDQAIACYRKALVAEPDLLEAHYNLADVLRDQNR